MTTLNRAVQLFKNRKLNLKNLKGVVIDEADDYWKTENDKANLGTFMGWLDPDYNKKVEPKKQHPLVPKQKV